MTTQTQTKLIPWSQIHVPAGANIRQSISTPEVKRLAASLLDKGQLAAVIVTNGGSKDQPYTLVAGFRRMAAFSANGWEDREVLANIITDIANDPVARLAVNWTENMQREDVSPLDQAEAMHHLVSGTYPVREGETAAPVDKKTICEKFDMSSNHLGSLVRVFQNVDPDLKVQAKKFKAPLRLLIAMSRCTGKNTEQIVERQYEMLKAWVGEQEALESQGRKRKKRGSAKGEGGDGEPKALLRPTKKIDDRGNAGDYLIVLSAKVENPETTREEKIKLAGMIELMRYLTGDLKKFPLLTKEDFIVLEEEEEEEGEEEGEEESE